MAASDYWNAFVQAAKRSSEENAAKQNAGRAMLGVPPINYDYNIIDFARDASPVGAAMNMGSALREGDYKTAGLNAALLGAEAFPPLKWGAKGINRLAGSSALKGALHPAMWKQGQYTKDQVGDMWKTFQGKPVGPLAVGADIRLTPKGLVGAPRNKYVNWYGNTYLPDLIKAEKSIYSPDIKIARHDTTRRIDNPLTIKEIMRPSSFKPNDAHRLLALNQAKKNANVRAGYSPDAGLFVTRIGDDLGSQKATSKTPLFVSYSIDDAKDLDNMFSSPDITEPIWQQMLGSKAWEAFIPPSQMEKIYNPLADEHAYNLYRSLK